MQKKSFLACLQQQSGTALLDRATHKTFHKGQQVIKKNDNEQHFYIVDKGAVRVTLYSKVGKEVSFADVSQGFCFGELSAIDKLPRSADVYALEKTDLFVFPEKLFAEMINQYPAVAIMLMRQLSQIVRRLCDRIVEYSVLNAESRIHTELLRMARNNIDLDSVSRINNPPSQSALASRISCSRETISREFQRLQSRGILHRKYKQWLVVDVEALSALVEQGAGAWV